MDWDLSLLLFFFFSSRRRHTRWNCDWSSDVCSSDLAAGCGAVIRLRHGAPGLARPYRTWGYPVTPIVFIAFAAWLVGNTIAEQPRDAGIGTALILAGLPFYYWWRRVAIRPPIPASRAAPAPAPPPASYRRT